MEGAAAAQTLLSNAGQLLSKEYQQLRGVGGQVVELRDELDAINALLVMQSEAEDDDDDDDDGPVDRFVQVCMRQLREVAYDAEDCIDLYSLRIQSRRANDNPNAGGGSCCRLATSRLGHLLRTLPSRRRLAGEIRALRARAVAIGERQARLGIHRDTLRRHRSTSPRLPVETRA